VRGKSFTGAIALTMLICSIAPAGAGARAVAASTRAIHESAHLHRTSRHATVVTESGTGSGTFNCPISLRIEVEEEVVSFTFTCATSKGTVSGGGSIRLHVADPTSHLSGTANLTHGTGIYRHVHASGLSVTGTVVTSNYATTLSVTGRMTY
jgi:hypothetical protein